MSDRLQRISDNAGRIYAALWSAPNPEKMVQDKTAVAFVVGLAVQIEQEVARQTLTAFAPSKSLCTCEDVPGDHARCPIHGES